MNNGFRFEFFIAFVHRQIVLHDCYSLFLQRCRCCSFGRRTNREANNLYAKHPNSRIRRTQQFLQHLLNISVLHWHSLTSEMFCVLIKVLETISKNHTLGECDTVVILRDCEGENAKDAQKKEGKSDQRNDLI